MLILSWMDVDSLRVVVGSIVIGVRPTLSLQIRWIDSSGGNGLMTMRGVSNEGRTSEIAWALAPTETP